MKIKDIFKKKIVTQTSEGALGIMINRSFTGDPQVRPLSWYEKVVYVNRAIEKRGEKVSEIKFILKKGNDEEIEEHEILDLLAKPNSNQTGEQFFKLWQEYKDIYGEVFVLVLKESNFLEEGRKISMIHLDPTICKPEYDNFGNFSGVQYNGVAGKYTADEIIYDNRPDPSNPKEGISLLKAGATVIETAIEFENQNYKTVMNGGKVEGVISIDSEMVTEENKDEFFANYRKQLEDLPENGGAVLLGGNAKYQDIARTMKELGYIESRKMMLQDICILCDVPKVLINALDDVKYDNADASIRMFLRDTIKPLMRQITTKLNENYKIVPKELELTFEDPTPNNLSDILKKNESGAKYRYMTINELRANVGLKEIEGGDELPKEPSFNLGGGNENEDDEEGNEEENEKSLKKKDFIHPLKSKEFRREYYKKRISKEDRYEAEFKRELNKYLKGQAKRLIESIEGKKRMTKSLLDSSFNKNTEITIGKLTLTPLLRRYMEKAGSDANSLVSESYDFVFSAEVERSLNNRADFFVGEITETTFNKLKGEFTESLEQGEGRRDLVKRIEGIYSDISKGRANTIARTEVHNVVQEGTLEGYKQAGMEIKIWVAVMDSVTRDEHAMLDGEERPIGVPFSNGLQYPSEINCRCVI